MGVVRRLAWSHSRGQLWLSCPRAFYFAYLSEGDPELAMARLLRRLRSLPMSSGNVVDGHVNLALRRVRAGRPLGVDLIGQAQDTLLQHLAASPARAEILRGGLDVRDHEHVLHRHYYGGTFEHEEVQRALAQVVESVDGFLQSEVLARLRRCSPSSLLLPPRSPSMFDLDGLTVFVAPDLMLRSKGRLLIVDWKSGAKGEQAEESAARQLGLYASFANRTMGYEVADIHLQAVWLREGGSWGPVAATPTLLGLVEAEALERAAEVRGLLIEEFGRGEVLLRAGLYAFEARPHPRRCAECRFLELCAEGQQNIGSENLRSST